MIIIAPEEGKIAVWNCLRKLGELRMAKTNSRIRMV